MGCWGLLGLLLIVIMEIIPENSLLSTSKSNMVLIAGHPICLQKLVNDWFDMSMLSNIGNPFWKNFACLCSPMWLIKNRGVAVNYPLGTSTSLGDILVISEKGSHLRKVPNNPGQKYLLYFLSNSQSPCIESGGWRIRFH